MGCRLPGGATNPDKLWQMLSEGRSGWSEVPADRWNRDVFYNKYPEAKESMICKSGYFLQEDISAFDAHFFGISPQEASAMDPQQRLLLETTYEALEHAGIPLEGLRGSDTSVFVAVFGRDYERMGFQDVQKTNIYQLTGTGDAIVSNRLSYFLDIHGASLSLDTGCVSRLLALFPPNTKTIFSIQSGSLVAVHLGCQSLRSGESNMSIVSGTEILISPDQSMGMSSVGYVHNSNSKFIYLLSRDF
jgi:acyl transferase domain-containing protein